jgi:hypothetical protein
VLQILSVAFCRAFSCRVLPNVQHHKGVLGVFLGTPIEAQVKILAVVMGTKVAHIACNAVVIKHKGHY